MTGRLEEYPREKWHGKRFYSLDAYCKNTYGEKLYKIALDAGMTCPNRDGTLDTRGCIFCSAGGSGEFAISLPLPPAAQLEAGKKLFRGKKTGSRYIAYFQAYTNTYAPPAKLEQLYREAMEAPDVAGISIATRPDCLPEEVLELLTDLRQRNPEKFVWIELGLQTVHERTAAYIRRGYALPVFERAVRSLASRGLPAIVHLILGLPGETKEDMLQSVRFLNRLPVDGVKLQLLHVLKGTDLAADYEKGLFRTLTEEEYLGLLVSCLEALSPDTVVHRLTGDGPAELLLAPLFSKNKKRVLNGLNQKLSRENTWQGRNYHDSGTIDPL